MERIQRIIHNINELNNELEKLRPEFEELWNNYVASKEISDKWVKLENFISAFITIGDVLGYSQVSTRLINQFPGLFDGSRLLSPHTKGTLQPYLRWTVQQTIKIIKRTKKHF